MQSVFTVGPDNRAQLRNIVTGDRVGDGWIVTQGLKPGDKVIEVVPPVVQITAVYQGGNATDLEKTVSQRKRS